jgi:hypothetical protein
MRITLLLSFALLLCLPSLEAGPQKKFVTKRLEMSNADKFAKDIVRFCLSDAKARVEMLNGGITITDTPACFNEIKRMAKRWQRDQTGPFVALHLKTTDHKKLKRVLKQKIDNTLLSEVSVLGPRKACPCIVLSGSRASELAEQIQLLQK